LNIENLEISESLITVQNEKTDIIEELLV